MKFKKQEGEALKYWFQSVKCSPLVEVLLFLVMVSGEKVPCVKEFLNHCFVWEAKKVTFLFNIDFFIVQPAHYLWVSWETLDWFLQLWMSLLLHQFNMQQWLVFIQHLTFYIDDDSGCVSEKAESFVQWSWRYFHGIFNFQKSPVCYKRGLNFG